MTIPTTIQIKKLQKMSISALADLAEDLADFIIQAGEETPDYITHADKVIDIERGFFPSETNNPEDYITLPEQLAYRVNSYLPNH